MINRTATIDEIEKRIGNPTLRVYDEEDNLLVAVPVDYCKIAGLKGSNKVQKAGKSHHFRLFGEDGIAYIEGSVGDCHDPIQPDLLLQDTKLLMDYNYLSITSFILTTLHEGIWPRGVNHDLVLSRSQT